VSPHSSLDVVEYIAAPRSETVNPPPADAVWNSSYFDGRPHCGVGVYVMIDAISRQAPRAARIVVNPRV
jgi:hypothetical protein